MDVSIFKKANADIQTSCVEHTNKHHCIWPNDVGSEIHSRKKSIIYRLSSVSWHYFQLHEIEKKITSEVNDLSNNSDRADIALKYYQILSYYFDDIVFNIVSLFDYLASFVCLVFNGNIAKQIKWNSLIKSFQHNDYDFPNTKELMLKIHKEWFNKLAGYRAGVFHNKNDSSFIILEDRPIILLPKLAQKNLPFFDNSDDISLIDGTETILETVLPSLLLIIRSCFNEKV